MALKERTDPAHSGCTEAAASDPPQSCNSTVSAPLGRCLHGLSGDEPRSSFGLSHNKRREINANAQQMEPGSRRSLTINNCSVAEAFDGGACKEWHKVFKLHQ